MKNLLKLIWINLLSFFEIHKIYNAQNINEKIKALLKVSLLGLAFIYLGIILFFQSKFLLKGLTIISAEDIILPLFMVLSSFYAIIMTLFIINKTVFDSKDYDILLSLPIKKTTVIDSKLITLYLSTLAFTILFMVPPFFAYLSYVNVSSLFYIYFVISLVFIPIIPTIIGAIFGTLLTGVSSKFKYKNSINTILGIVFFIVIFGFSYKITSVSSIDIANISKSITEIFSRIYPITNLYIGIIDLNIYYLMLFILISIAFYQGYKHIVVIFFDKINSNLQSITIKNKVNYKKIKVNNSVIALFKKEVKKYGSSSLYILNSSIGILMLLMMLAGLIIMGPNKLSAMLEIPNFANIITMYAPLALSAFAIFTCTTNSSISLEGKKLWIIKSVPVKITDIFLSKIMLNLALLIPAILIGGIVITIYFKLSFDALLLILFTPLMYSVFISQVGLLVNLMFPDFSWKNEVKVIKQSLPIFITTFGGIAIIALPIYFHKFFSPEIFSLGLGVIMLLINIILYYLLINYGVKKFKSLY